MALNLSLSKTPWYVQLATFLTLGAAAVGIFWNWHARARQEDIEARRAQVATMRAEIDRGLATARRLPEFREDVATLEAQLERLRAVLPEEKDVADLLRRIQGMATQSNLDIRDFSPRPIANKQLYAEWPIGLQFEGTYHDLGNFLERVSKFPRIINVTGIKIRAKEDGEDRTIVAECVATTFVLLEQSAVAAARPAQPAAAGAPRTE
ncbi:MAG: type 4a pilus biogenesis protein PilO [Acidobacteria bacterium]|nr:type 4a pilus biogenesis protein PilO [Acidobacteriota bacterium]